MYVYSYLLLVYVLLPPSENTIAVNTTTTNNNNNNKTIKARDARRITAAEMKYLRRTAGYTWDRLQNKCINCKGVKNNTNFGQITGIQEKLDTTRK